FSAATDLVVTRSFAERVFAGVDVVGESVRMAQGPVLRITAVIEDLPVNSHLSGTAFAPMALRDLLGGEPREQQWSQTGFYTYVQLRPGTAVAEMQDALDTFALAAIPQPASGQAMLSLQAIAEIHLHPVRGDWPGKPAGNTLHLAAFIAIGIGILL